MGSTLLLDRSVQNEPRNETKTLAAKDSTKKEEEEPLTLGSFLEAMDGMIDHNGRICIFTTNYPDRLDKALMRPGRIDLVIEMKKMRRVDVADIYKLWFNDSIPKNVYDKMTDYQFSQAEIGNLFSQYRDNVKQIHKKLY